MDPERGPLVAKLFEWYATGTVSLKEVTARAAAIGLTHPRSARKLTKSEIHRVLHNPIYAGEFRWKGKQYAGLHTPIISRRLFEDVQDVFAVINRPRYTKHQHAFAGLMTCGRCGCAITAELKKGKYVYYHCTGFKGKCGEPYVREEVLEEQFGQHLVRLRIDQEVFDWIVRALRESCSDEKREHSDAIARLQVEWDRLQKRIDAMYVDKLDGRIEEGFYKRMRAQWRDEQERCERDMERHRGADDSYMDQGIQILSLGQNAHRLFAAQPAKEKRSLLNFLLSNSTWAHGALSVQFKEPFDLLAETVEAAARVEAAQGATMARNEIWLGD